MTKERRIVAALRAPYHRIFVRDEESGAFTALVLEWPGCISEGDSLEQANAMLEDAMTAWASVILKDGRSLPEPLATEYSGKMLLRIPKATHRLVTLRAAEEGMSANTLLVSFIEAGLAR